jgi:AcrR family transcriptional regulator
MPRIVTFDIAQGHRHGESFPINLNNAKIIRSNLNSVKILLEGRAVSIYPVDMAKKRSTKRRAKRGPSYHHGALYDALVRAARAILEKRGSAALSLRGAARLAGVSPAAPYHHFADKQALLDAVAAQGFDALTSAMEKRMAKQTNPQGRLDASGMGYIVFALEHPALFRLMFGGGDQQLSADTGLMAARNRAYDVLQTAVAATSPDRIADRFVCLRLWALVHGIATLILDGGIKPAEYGRGETLITRLLREPGERDQRNDVTISPDAASPRS